MGSLHQQQSRETGATGYNYDQNGNRLGRIGAVPEGFLISADPGVMTPLSRGLGEGQSWKGPRR